MITDQQEILKRKLEIMFPLKVVREEIIEILKHYGTESYEQEIGRVRLDILKVAGASIDAVKMWVDVAKKDYRDVLAAAEYPRQLVSPTWRMNPGESLRIQAGDRKQYEEWLNQK